MSTLRDLLTILKLQGVLGNPQVRKAFLEVDRADFVHKSYSDSTYENHPLPLGWGQTISQPYTVAFMLDLLDVQPGDSILDIGSGSGWTTALLANLTGPTGSVHGLERIAVLAEFGASNLAKYSFPHAHITTAAAELGTPCKVYDRILVSAASDELPEELVLQLKTGGVMVIPVENYILKITKKSLEEMDIEEHYGFTFVPLVR
ncbi:MAG: hypothetical protein KAQ69_04135 [Spirochaetales bacterium]|nr:hypothetical protein [Spirochaetales bacterium]